MLEEFKIVLGHRDLDQGCKRDGILRDGWDRASKIISFVGRDGTGIFGTAGRAKNGTKRDPAIFSLIKNYYPPVIFFDFFEIETRNRN